ncbi:MAG: DNA methyltransferase [Syntrophaceae bacterium]
MSDIIWKLKSFDLDELTDYYKNPRSLTKQQFNQLKKSLDKFGMIDKPIINADDKNTVIGGHQRLRVIREGNQKSVECWYPSRELNEKEAEELNIRLNKNTGDWDFDILANEFEFGDLVEWGFDEKELLGLDFEEEEPKDAEAQIDRAAELNEKWQVKTGDLWQIGEHRLLCGDSTIKADVDRVMQSDKIDLLFTSPPYGQQRDYTDDTKEKVKDWDGLMNGVFSYIPGNDDIQIIVNLGLIHEDNEWQPYYDNWIAWMRGNGWRRFGLYVWDQGFGLMGDWNGRLAPSFEFIFHFNKISKQPNKIIEKHADSIKIKKGEGLRKKDGSIGKLTNPEASLQTHKIPDSVVRIFRSSEAIRQLHPAVFSLSFAEFNIETWSNEGDISYEPFCGSGTTMVACENLHRKCRAIEISPNYCSVILQRMQDAFEGIDIHRIDQLDIQEKAR